MQNSCQGEDFCYYTLKNVRIFDATDFDFG